MTADPTDISASGLLDGLDGEARAQRAELVEWLMGRGITADQIRQTFSPMLLASRQLAGDDGTYVSTRAISEQTGMDIGLIQRLQRAMGLPTVEDPEAAVLLRADAEAVGFAERFLELGIDRDQVVLITRVLAEGLGRAAEVMRYAALAAVLMPAATELETAKAAEALVAEAAPLIGPMIRDMLFVQLRHSMETEAVSTSERAEGVPLPGARLVTIAFADIVGFTRLGEVVQPEDLERLANRLADAAREVALPPVRLIKTIGDAVMFVSTDPAALLDAVLQLVAATETDEGFPRLRVGLATGPAVSRAGDWFGSSVNLASRVTGAARAGTVLVAESTRIAIAEAGGEENRFSWSFAGARHLKGVKSDVKLFRARSANSFIESSSND
ncbi:MULTISPECIES: adenylate/guanylate cyclase domain-containing protein [unclassified Mycolicibacterium]|uniref:adenylate/guanylate cyclase domain-containing protein n=1 Tax=unclassified Mycolicibacterium TaxID=2636767 RepID=UPI0012DE6C72|nr:MULTISPECIES: adenylate/guanylate cyclase domain-containing protein [unclassified Mycolicibacterium]MUL84897.1 adenylate/guanylate cyclase domain-containing protein [Mycolicibacterium sp. CBMA 329]MUL90864.1 adenylate/guanylate cyclase domain-containing protein [Mycolicibacterium sp. CBMA 331]MUM01812.1 adenylate/guanylate cyclase domain-containing protein [Mycolicibacterium sp. CBMA 334]MUM29268.1 adenylate/guanylate cyclase domain-containing protein [Mycolicibacterium sp. CBMA 295]MUM4062